MGSISLIQLPYDSGRFGGRMGRGPIALIESGLVEHLRSLGNEVDFASCDLSEGLHNEANALVSCRDSRCRCSATQLAGELESDHFKRQLWSCCLKRRGSAQSSETGIIWFDAHADFNTPETSRSGFLDGMGLAILTGRCWRRLAEQFKAFSLCSTAK